MTAHPLVPPAFVEAAEDAQPPTKRRKSSTSPTTRTLAECRKRGWTAQRVEKPWDRYTKVSVDLFGCIDVLAMTDEMPPRFVGIQACAGASHAARVAKCAAEPRMVRWLAAGALLEVWSWSKRGANGKRKLWTLRVERVEVMSDESKEIAEIEARDSGRDVEVTP